MSESVSMCVVVVVMWLTGTLSCLWGLYLHVFLPVSESEEE